MTPRHPKAVIIFTQSWFNSMVSNFSVWKDPGGTTGVRISTPKNRCKRSFEALKPVFGGRAVWTSSFHTHLCGISMMPKIAVTGDLNAFINSFRDMPPNISSMAIFMPYFINHQSESRP